MSLGGGGPPPQETAGQQQQLNLDALRQSAQFNQLNQFTPFGSLTYSGALGTDTRRSELTLSPEVQALIDSQLGVSQGLTNQANIRLGQLTTDPFDINAAGGRRIDLDTTDRFGRPMIRRLEQRPLRGAFEDAGQLTRSLDDAGQVTRGVDTTGARFADARVAGAGRIGRNLGFGGLGALPGAGDFTTERQRVEDALFQRQAGRISPQFERDIDRRIDQLAQQGITEFSNPVAFQEGLRPFIEGRTDALERAGLGAIAGAGSEQSRLFSDVLASRQQQAGELAQQGQFGNLAQGQLFGQNLARTQAGLQGTQINNAALQQMFGQNLQAGAFANQAQQQQFGQNLQAGVFANQAQGQQFGQNMETSQFFNDAQMQRLAGDQAIFGADIQAGQFGNQARDSFLNELILQRNQPFNELSSFLGGAPAAPTPSFMTQPAFQMAGADLVGLQVSRNQAKAKIMAGLYGGIGDLGGAAIGGWG